MAKSNQKLPPKLEAVVVRLGKAASLNVTQAVKLPYLVDVAAMRALGHRITEGTHQAWDHGVVTKEVWHFLDKCEDSPLFHLEAVRWSEEKRVVIDAEEPASALAPEEQQVVDFVAREFAAIRAGSLGRMTKLMNPGISTWGKSNYTADLGPEACDRMSADYLRMADQAASVTLDQLRSASSPVYDIEDAVA
jgi:uncharacterized phage-associated protein